MLINKESSMIHDLIDTSARKYDDKVAFNDGSRKFSFKEIDILSKRLANQFLLLGLRKGDVVAVQLPNSFEFVIAHLAISRIGLILNPLSPFYRKKELAYMLSLCRTKALITVDSFKGFNHEKLAIELKSDLIDLEHIIVAGKPAEEESIVLEELFREDTLEEFLEDPPVRTDAAFIMFTSGTASNPKAVLHTYESFVPAHLMNGKENQLSAQDRILSLTPLCHMFSMPLVITGMTFGALHYITSNYQVDEVMDLIKKEEITYVTAAPAQLIDIVHFMKKNNIQNNKLRLIQTGGSKIPSQMVKDLRNLTSANVISQWGMTEICAGTFTRPDDKESLSWETVGRSTEAGEVVILNERHLPVLSGESGEIAFKGNCLFKEYYRNEAATNRAFTADGYFLTGDQGWLDDDGYLYFVGRKEDTINRGGLKFHASEIEEVLLMHPKIKQAAVISVTDERLGERACAFISLRDNQTIELPEINEFLLEKGFAKYKLPEFLQIKSELPTAPSGKVTKGPLRDEAKLL